MKLDVWIYYISSFCIPISIYIVLKSVAQDQWIFKSRVDWYNECENEEVYSFIWGVMLMKHICWMNEKSESVKTSQNSTSSSWITKLIIYDIKITNADISHNDFMHQIISYISSNYCPIILSCWWKW